MEGGECRGASNTHRETLGADLWSSEGSPHLSAGRMTRPLEQAVSAIVCTFQEYAGRCGDKYKLCQSELKELLQKELPTFKPVSRVHHRTARGSHGHPPSQGHQLRAAKGWQQGRKWIWSLKVLICGGWVQKTWGSSRHI